MLVDFPHGFYYLSLLGSSFISIFLYRNVDKPFQWLIILMLVTSISEIIAKYLAFELFESNNIVYHFFTPLEFSIYCIIYYFFIRTTKYNTYFILLSASLIIFEIINTIFFQSFSVSNTNTLIIESVFLVTLSLLLFYQLKEEPLYDNLLHEGVFWFNSAILIYYCFNILVWGFHNLRVYELTNPPKLMYDINLILSGFLYLIFLFSICLGYKKFQLHLTNRYV